MMTEEQKSLGQVCHEACLIDGPDWAHSDQAAWEHAAQAVVDAWKEKYTLDVFAAKPGRKGKRLRELEARVAILEEGVSTLPSVAMNVADLRYRLRILERRAEQEVMP